MPYKDPERKRQWEREHREQRNARRRMRTQTARSGHQSVATPPLSDALRALRARQKQASDPVSSQEPKSTWKTVLGWAVEIGVVLLAALAAVDVTPYGDLGASSGSGNTGIS